MDKASYVKAYPIHQRMKGGKLPRRGVMVDESSGSSGTPTSWVRGPVERQIVSQMMRLSYRELVDRHRPVFILNAFALGAWATGMNVSLSLTPSSIVKSTGPNLDKIVGTMLEFGPGYRYVVMGYPPFLKGLADDPGSTGTNTSSMPAMAAKAFRRGCALTSPSASSASLGATALRTSK